MNLHDHSHSPAPAQQQTINWILWGLIGVASVVAVIDRGALVFGGLPYLLLLACSVTHVLTRGDHGNGQGP